MINVINALRFDENYGGVLKDRSALAAYCRRTPESSFGGDGREYGFRVDTEQYSYMLRLNPNRGEYNLYCYCYVRQWLDRHLHHAEKGIRFITPDYKEKFRIDDGDKIRITLSTDETMDRICRYIDDYHVEVGRNLYHICQFAELMERNGNTVIPLRSSLPEQCHSVLPDTGELIIIKKGESGYYRTDIDMGSKAENRALADECNAKSGVSKAQEQAMSAGSMFGWAVPAADPKNYDEIGQPIRPKHRDRGGCTMNQECRPLWVRLGISIQATPMEIENLMCGNSQTKATTISKIFSEGRVQIDGDSYIPSNVIAEYNLEYGTNYSREEMDLETGTLDGKSLRVAGKLLNRNRGDAR